MDNPIATGNEHGDSVTAVDGLERTREELHDMARERLGVTGVHSAPPMRRALRENRVGLYPLFALGVLAVFDGFQVQAFTVLTPDIAEAMGLSLGAIAGVRTLRVLVGTVAPLAVAAMTQTRARRALVCILGAIGWSMLTFANGLVINLAGLALVLALDGFFNSTNDTLARPLLLDTYPPPVRVRVLSWYHAFNSFGGVFGPLLIFVSAGIFDLTWRGVFIVLGAFSVAGALFTVRLRDPGFGKWDTERVREAVHKAHGESYLELSTNQVRLGFFEILRRLLLIPTVRRIAFGFMVFGSLVIPLGTIMAFYLEERWEMDTGDRALFSAFMSGLSIAILIAQARWGEKVFRKDPGRVVDIAGLTLAGAVVCIVLGTLSPFFVGMLAFFALSTALTALLLPQLGIVMLSVVEASWRPHVGAYMGVFVAAGSVVGLIFLTGVESEFGLAGAMISLLVPGVVGSLIIRSARGFVLRDMDRMIDEVLEGEEIGRISSSGGHLPLLSCRKIDFSYGQLQVLFDVNFSVDDGEMVALLGTNGAGKSTLLKVISGIGLPTSGTVRYGGQDITYLDAERRVGLGISQVPGGHAVFAPMDVVENLRLLGYTLRRNHNAVDSAIERSFEAFPHLYERRHSKASTLSGGEQQMLGLSKALILRPRILLIDELSLGLAPVIVAQLLDMVRTINAEGTSVILVEQSVNIALTVAHHTYFMEKGQIRFDGASKDLLARGDLLRAVFLEGATKGASQ